MFVGTLLVAMASGCAGMSPTQIGQTAGTIAGAAIVPGIGAPLGALAGMLAGMLVQGHVDQVTETRERKELGDQLARGHAQPAAAAAAGPGILGTPTRVWVDEDVHDGRLIAGHFEVRNIQ